MENILYYKHVHELTCLYRCHGIFACSGKEQTTQGWKKSMQVWVTAMNKRQIAMVSDARLMEMPDTQMCEHIGIEMKGADSKSLKA